MRNLTGICGPRHLCRRWKTCERCGRIRQAQFADRAEHAARLMHEPTYYVLVPTDDSPAGIEYARRFFVRHTRPLAGVWTVEKGEISTGLHLNVIAEWCDIDKKFKGHIYREPVRTHIRHVAAYAAKRKTAATKEDGITRSIGDFGRAIDWLKADTYDTALVRAVAIQEEIAPDFLPPSGPPQETPYETARRWLDALYAENARRKAEGVTK